MQSDRITTPFAVRLLKPRIILPKTVNMDDKQLLNYVLTHEYYHIKRYDALWKLLFVFTLCIHWFNPMVWVMFVLANRDLELICDLKVIRHFGTDSKTAYAYSLIGLAEHRGNFAPLYNGFSKNAAEERIVSIMKIKKNTVLGIAIAALIVGGVITVFAASGGNVTAAQSAGVIDDSETKFEGLGFSNLSDLASPLQEIGLTFINVSVYPHTTDWIDWNNPHIGRLSQDEPIRISSKADVDLLLEVVRIGYNQGVGSSWDTCVNPDAIEEAGFYDYWLDNIRQIHRPKREKALIDLATNNTFDELVQKGLFLRIDMLEEFQALGFFMDYTLDNVPPMPIEYTRAGGFSAGFSAVTRNDEYRYTPEQWANILKKVEKGEILLFDSNMEAREYSRSLYNKNSLQPN